MTESKPGSVEEGEIALVDVFWRRFLSTWSAIMAAGIVFFLIAGKTIFAVSLSIGALVALGALWMIKVSCASLVSRQVQSHQRNPGGKFRRGALFAVRFLVLLVLVKASYLWHGFSPAAFVVGVVLTQLALLLSAVKIVKQSSTNRP